MYYYSRTCSTKLYNHRRKFWECFNLSLILHSADVELRLEPEESYIKNTAYATIPLVVHGNGPSKTVLNSLGNYVAKSWSLQDGCYSCNDNHIDLSKKKVLEASQYLG